MVKITGKTVVLGASVGIPGILITLYFASKDSPTVAAGPHGEVKNADGNTHWEKWGSLLTTATGEFEIAAEDEPTESRSRGMTVKVVASSPSANVTEGDASELAVCVRRVGRIEYILLRIEEAKLKTLGIRVPGRESDAREQREREQAEAERQSHLEAISRKARVEELKRSREVEREAEPKFQRFLSALSGIPEDLRNLDQSRIVPRGADIVAANSTVIQFGIEQRVNQSVRAGALSLNESEMARFKDANGQLNTQISFKDLETVLRPGVAQPGPALSVKLSPALLCRENAPKDPCVEILEGKSPDEVDDDDTHDHQAASQDATDPLQPIGPAEQAPLTNIPGLIQNLVSAMTPPESTSIFQMKRADLGTVQTGVTGFQLHSGPADAPSFHDFHHLQIAFEHVWQELVDEKLKAAAKKMYADIVELGIDPNEYIWGGKLDLTPILPSKKAPPCEVVQAFEITQKQWSAMPPKHQEQLTELSKALITTTQLPVMTVTTETKSFGLLTFEETEESFDRVSPILPGKYYSSEVDPCWRISREKHQNLLRRQGERMIGYANAKILANQEFDQFHPLLDSLKKAMAEVYRFSVFAADRNHRSINFGVVATYRQKWEKPTDGNSYQVGRLVKSVPLAPKEVRRFTKKVSVRQSRAEKEVQNNLHSRKTESEEKSRVEAEIVQKALNKTNYHLGAEGGVNIAIAHAKGSTSLTQDAATESNEVKKEFHEAIQKAAEEYKSERTLEINVSSGEETSFEESGEISNPNDEIPVTYLFYELQQRFRVTERIHRVTPVVLVAQEFPSPHEIDEDWLVRHDWILRRVILDDSFVPALNYLSTKVVGDEFALQEVFNNIQQQRRTVDDLKGEIIEARGFMEGRYTALQKSIEKRARAIEEDSEEGFFETGAEALFGSKDSSPEAMKAREDAARDAYDRIAKQERGLQAKLEREITALNSLMETYAKNLSEHLNRREQISRLRVHVKDNIMYYMQAIWSHEPPDQRFFRLHQVRVPDLQGKLTCKLEPDPDGIPMPPTWEKPYKFATHCKLDPKFGYKSLEEFADLDNLLGFKGNYMIFPLKQSNVLTDFMMVPYLDPVVGLRDPDPIGNWSLSDFTQYVCCLRKKLSKAEFANLLPALRVAYQRILNSPGSDGDEIIVPTDSIFIEALPGVHPILEDFKLMHRAVDVKKAQAEVRAAEFENLRAADRLLHGERDDPTIEKKVVVDSAKAVVMPDGG